MTAQRTLTTLALLGSLACSRVEARDAGTPDAGTDAGTPGRRETRRRRRRPKWDAGAIDAGATLHVLFIGDSYTYVNDLPGMLAMIAATSGGAARDCHGRGRPGWRFARNAVGRRAGRGSHSGRRVDPGRPAGPERGTTGLGCRRVCLLRLCGVRRPGGQEGAQPTLFVTWARAAGAPEYTEGEFVSPEEMQDELTFAYAQVAQQWPQSILVCVGEAFERAIAQYPGIVLQQTDFSHPTVAGTYLAASTFYVGFDRQPRAFPEQRAGRGQCRGCRQPSRCRADRDRLRDVRPKGVIAASFGADFDGGPPFDFGTAGVPVPMQFELANVGSSTVDISDGMTLSPPFVWTAGGAFPGALGTQTASTSVFARAHLRPMPGARSRSPTPRPRPQAAG